MSFRTSRTSPFNGCEIKNAPFKLSPPFFNSTELVVFNLALKKCQNFLLEMNSTF